MATGADDASGGEVVAVRPPADGASGDDDASKRQCRHERGSLFSRLRLGGGDSPQGSPAAAKRGDTAQMQQLEAVTGQLEAVTSCVREEQQARCRAEAELESAREQIQSLLRHLSETERVRKEEATTLAGMRGLLSQLEGENKGLKEQNASLVEQCRRLMEGQTA